MTCGGVSCRVLLGKLVSSKDMQSCSCLFAVTCGGSLFLQVIIIVVGVYSVVAGISSLSRVVCKLLSPCGVRFVCNSRRGAPIYV